MKIDIIKIGCFGAVLFSVLFISPATAMTMTHLQTTVQEKLIYITLSLELFCIIVHKIRSRVSYACFETGEGGERKR